MHGGDIYRNDVRYDFSVNVNPLGMPAAMKAAIEGAMEHLDEYPDPEAAALKNAIAGRLGVPAPQIIPGNGASEIFMAAVHAVRPTDVLLLTPSFSGYDYSVRSLEECRIRYYGLREEDGFAVTGAFLEAIKRFSEEVYTAKTFSEEVHAEKTFSEMVSTTPKIQNLTQNAEKRAGTPLIFLACPNNPNGLLIGPDFLKEIITVCDQNRVYLVLDECFLDFSPRVFEYRKMLVEIQSPYLIRTGAYTKICAIPGVRLGFAAVSDEGLREKMGKMLPEWNLSAFAQAAGCAVYDEAEWIRKTQEHLEKERACFAKFFEMPEIRKMIKVYPSEANYMLLYTELPLYDILLKEGGILIRDCSDYPGLKKGFYRIAIRDKASNTILRRYINALRWGRLSPAK